MCKSQEPLFCPHCEVYVPPPEAVADQASGAYLCPACDTPLVPESQLMGNPFTVTLGLRFIGVVARTIVRSGALDRFEEHALESPNKLDDFVHRLVAAVIREAARL